jgi:serine/threonine protein kinase
VTGDLRTAAASPIQEDLTATGTAPAFPPPLPTEPLQQSPPDPAGLPGPGHRLGDFELLAVLGTGSFATVFLARQLSLGRQVALKVSANRGQEARTLASLEHDHIVRVFAEAVDAEHDLRLLCMQYIPGTTLERVIRALAKRDRREWGGRAIQEAVDELSSHPTPLDPAALRDRQFLADCDFVEAACWIGARVAEALAHAHGQGVFHRDVKPANILLNRYGRPLLADFNIAFAGRSAPGPAGPGFGGTLAYMAPEHLDAFNASGPTPPDAVDQRSDVYSLGVVLFQLLTGRLPFEPPGNQGR